MNYAAEWDEAHSNRLMIATGPDPRLIEFSAFWSNGRKPDEMHRVCWLDVGCGTGLSCQWLTSIGYSVCGFDSSPHALARANWRLTAQARRLPRLILADATKPWPYRNQVFHALVDIRSLENLSHDEMRFAWKEAYRVLYSGGRFMSVCASELRDDALTATGAVTKLGADEIAALVRDAGFTATVEAQQCVSENSKVVEDWMIVAQKP